ncbi:MAG: hypothetical protein KatS3mg003_0041 [Candidatus Nitrosocaldaceae archaeon]|nr:MAG: hypothetical protein KatS3mg003_0041 [Candidatus Nitrosocaldaceae archaeon]
MKDEYITSRYKIIDGIAYGREFREGIELNKLIDVIKTMINFNITCLILRIWI